MEQAQPASSEFKEFEFRLRSATVANHKKKYNVGKFPPEPKLDFEKMEKPLKMKCDKFQEKEVELPNLNPSNPRSIRRKQMERFYERKAEGKRKKVEKTWHLEDSTGENTFEGHLEGGQTANYFLFMMEGHAFTVYPVSEWFNFKAKKSYTTLSLEEAEAQLHTRNNKVERWMMEKYHTIKKEESEMKVEKEEDVDDKSGEPDETFAALGGFDSEDEKEKGDKSVESKLTGDGEEDELFEDFEDRGEEPDFEKSVSDDEEEGLPEGEEETENKKSFGEETSDNESTQLTDAGKDLKTLLKKVEKEEDGYHSSSSEDEEDEDKFDVNELDMYPKREPKLEQSVVIKEEPKEAKAEKRPRSPSSTGSEEANKKVKKEQPDKLVGKTATGPITEEEVRVALLLSGKTKTKSLVNKFKSRLTDKAQKARFAQLVKKLGKIVDEHGEKYLLLKDEYKYKDKPQIQQIR